MIALRAIGGKPLNIIARKPADDRGNEHIVVDNTNGTDRQRTFGPGAFVSATANARSLRGGEWFDGRYFSTLADAIAHFDAR